MPPELAAYIVKYGYLSIFSLVFLQEIGIPNPVPNELVLLFSGYLSYIHTLNFAGVFATVVAADFIGTSILYFVFYFFGHQIIKRWPNLLSRGNTERLEKLVSTKNWWSIYVGRLLPYVRGYVSVVAGLIGIPPRMFLPSVILSAMTWSGGYVIAGHFLGPQWSSVIDKLGFGPTIVTTVGALLLIFILGPSVYRWFKGWRRGKRVLATNPEKVSRGVDSASRDRDNLNKT